MLHDVLPVGLEGLCGLEGTLPTGSTVRLGSTREADRLRRPRTGGMIAVRQVIGKPRIRRGSDLSLSARPAVESLVMKLSIATVSLSGDLN